MIKTQFTNRIYDLFATIQARGRSRSTGRDFHKDGMQNTTETSTICFPNPLPTYHFISRLISGLVGVSGNALLLASLIYDPFKCFRNSSSRLILNLCISDIIVCLEVVVLLFWRDTCINGVNIYIFFHLPVHVSFSSIATMAFDRFMSSVYPLKYRIIITGKFTQRLILLQWTFQALSVTFEFFFEKWFLYPRLLVGITIISSATVMYGKTVYTLRRQSGVLKRMFTSSSSSRHFNNVRVMNEKRFLNTVLLVSLITIFTLFPLIMYELCVARQRYYENERLPPSKRDDIHMWLLTLYFVNFWINPFVYSWRLTKYRRTYLVILKKIMALCIGR